MDFTGTLKAKRRALKKELTKIERLIKMSAGINLNFEAPRRGRRRGTKMSAATRRKISAGMRRRFRQKRKATT